MEVVGTGRLGVARSLVIVWERIFGFLWLVLSWKQGEKLRKLSPD